MWGFFSAIGDFFREMLGKTTVPDPVFVGGPDGADPDEFSQTTPPVFERRDALDWASTPKPKPPVSSAAPSAAPMPPVKRNIFRKRPPVPQIIAMPGRTPHRAVQLIKAFEGLHKVRADNPDMVFAYHDPIGLATQGWGHLLSRKHWPDLKGFRPLSIEECVAVLHGDLKHFETGVIRLVKVPIHPFSFGALVSFSFNLGLGALQSSTLLKHVNRDEWEDIPFQFSRWNKAGGRVLKGLVRRREAEGDMWQEGADLIN